MTWLGNLLRRARIRGLVEGKVQRARAEALDDDAKDDAERWQDYGFAANPVDGQGLVLNVAGHTIVVRLDRIAERPQLDAYEVALWHKEGHMVRLKAGKVVEVSCDELVVNAATSVAINSPWVTVSASSGVTLDTPQVQASGDVAVAGSAAVSGGVGAGGAAPVVGKVLAPAVEAASSLKVAGVQVAGHTHPGVQAGGASTGAMA